MAGETTPVTPAKKKKVKYLWHWIIGGILLILIIVFIWLYIVHKKEQKAIAAIIDKEIGTEGTAEDRAKIRKLLVDATDAIIVNPLTNHQAKNYAKDMGISYEQSVVDMAIAQLKSTGALQVS